MNNSKTALWQNIDQLKTEDFTSQQWSWLADKNSLTLRLRNTLSNQIEFRLISAGLSRISEEERLALSISKNCEHWVREIEWCYQNKPVIAARVVIPADSNSPHALALYTAGKASIGDILFKEGGYTRDKISVAKLPPSHAYFKLASKDDALTAPYLLARRSIFHHQQVRLLVSEIFLPGFFSAVANPD